MGDMIEMTREAAPQLLSGVGAALIVFHALDLFKQYLFLDSLAEVGRIAGDLFFQDVFDSLLTRFVVSNFGVLFSSVAGFVLAAGVVYYLVMIFRNPDKQKFLVMMILGIVAVFLSSGLGGILVAIGGYVGMRKFS